MTDAATSVATAAPVGPGPGGNGRFVERWHRILVGVLVLCLLPVTGLVLPAASAQQARLDDRLQGYEQEQDAARAELEALEADAARARERLDDTLVDLQDAELALAALTAELAAAEDALAAARTRLATAEQRLAAVTRELADTEAELEEKQARLDARLRAAYMYGHVSVLETFTGIRDVSDLVLTTNYVGRVLRGDQELVVDVQTLRDAVTLRQQDADDLRREAARQTVLAEAAAADVEAALADQARLTRELDDRRAAYATELATLQAEATEVTAHLEALAAASAQVEAELREAQRQAEARLAREREEQARRAAEEAARREAAAAGGSEGGTAEGGSAEAGTGDDGAADRGAGDGTGQAPDAGRAPDAGGAPSPGAEGWLRPTEGRVTSPYGYRVHPIRGTRLLHAGVDLASGTGTPIRAARSGVVTDTRWIGGYGYTVLLYHGDGIGTLYAHLSAFEVAPGQLVSQGQVIGREGMTGTATGPHLHFEVRINGAPVDPCGYIRC